MFEELGLNVARQSDNGANPRPDNRTGWLQGGTPEETPDVIGSALAATAAPPAGDQLNVSLWDPSSQLRFEPKRNVPPRPDGAPNAGRDLAA
jgi:biotin synthase